MMAQNQVEHCSSGNPRLAWLQMRIYPMKSNKCRLLERTRSEVGFGPARSDSPHLTKIGVTEDD
jgi:hypothetical protein